MSFLRRDIFRGRSDVQQIMLILSDGYSKYFNDVIKSAATARNDGIRIAAISVTTNPSLKNLRLVISHPHHKYLFVASKFVNLMKLEKAWVCNALWFNVLYLQRTTIVFKFTQFIILHLGDPV
jgi:hypothetical protein